MDPVSKIAAKCTSWPIFILESLRGRYSDGNQEDMQAKYRISNAEPQKSGPDFDIHHSLFDILRFKNLQKY